MQLIAAGGLERDRYCKWWQ